MILKQLNASKVIFHQHQSQKVRIVFCGERESDGAVSIDSNEILKVQKLAEEIMSKLYRSKD